MFPPQFKTVDKNSEVFFFWSVTWLERGKRKEERDKDGRGFRVLQAVSPLDVAKKKNHYPDKATETNPLKVLRSIHKRTGLKGCYADLGPTILRALPANAGAIVAWDVGNQTSLGLVLEPNRHLMSFLVTEYRCQESKVSPTF
ncbi:unnamed protein product [Brassica oleracea var. botrytis]|uniref:(rape) hypothetical protein n=1 Tax=Brassica napus TaxID=3708 RepID=A0A816IAZ7_BRANA|nr:unnamed protein product [Brassica napus]